MQTTAGYSSTERQVEAALEHHFRVLTRNRLAIGGVLGFLGAAALVASWFQQHDAETRGFVAMGALCLLGAFAVAWLAIADPRTSKAAKVLRTRHHEIVWAYRVVGGATGIVLGLRTGESFVLAGAREDVLELLAPALAHATLGYQPDRAAVFRARPESLARA